MGITDFVLVVVIVGAAGWLLYHSLRPNKGGCAGCTGCACGKAQSPRGPMRAG